MKLNKHFDPNNLHHAYLIEGVSEEIVPEIEKFVQTLGLTTVGNADVCRITVDSFKIEDARNLKSYAGEKSLSSGPAGSKKIFIISANTFLLEAQNSLLKLFEEPAEDTHFFVVTPDTDGLLKTLVSRFYVVSRKTERVPELESAEKFVTMPLRSRLDFIKDLVAKEDEEDGVLQTESPRSKALTFLNALEFVLHRDTLASRATHADIKFFDHFFKVHQFLRMPGSSAKTLMESVALITPGKQ